ncbi:hypothetical protein [Nocardia pseudovaccinii]|uniref:hypothetical protein n=1 Tax=Nocardia pseudovaccinii TaxID=189540 RepID=UPI0007A49BBD|nr:hypothetical protein [Nocardia pseudovaccinii]
MNPLLLFLAWAPASAIAIRGFLWLAWRGRREEASRALRWLMPATVPGMAVTVTVAAFDDIGTDARMWLIAEAVGVVAIYRIGLWRFDSGSPRVMHVAWLRLRRGPAENAHVDKQQALLASVAEAVKGGPWVPQNVSRPLITLIYTEHCTTPMEHRTHHDSPAYNRSMHMVIHRRAFGLPWLVDLVEDPAPWIRARRRELTIDEALQVLADPDQAWTLPVR